MTSTTISNWREYFLTSKQFHYLDENLIQLRESIDPNTEILKNFDDISKKTGVCFIALDPLETNLIHILKLPILKFIVIKLFL